MEHVKLSQKRQVDPNPTSQRVCKHEASHAHHGVSLTLCLDAESHECVKVVTWRMVAGCRKAHAFMAQVMKVFRACQHHEVSLKLLLI